MKVNEDKKPRRSVVTQVFIIGYGVFIGRIYSLFLRDRYVSFIHRITTQTLLVQPPLLFCDRVVSHNLYVMCIGETLV